MFLYPIRFLKFPPNLWVLEWVLETCIGTLISRWLGNNVITTRVIPVGVPNNVHHYVAYICSYLKNVLNISKIFCWGKLSPSICLRSVQKIHLWTFVAAVGLVVGVQSLVSLQVLKWGLFGDADH